MIGGPAQDESMPGSGGGESQKLSMLSARRDGSGRLGTPHEGAADPIVEMALLLDPEAPCAGLPHGPLLRRRFITLLRS